MLYCGGGGAHYVRMTKFNRLNVYAASETYIDREESEERDRESEREKSIKTN